LNTLNKIIVRLKKNALKDILNLLKINYNNNVFNANKIAKNAFLNNALNANRKIKIYPINVNVILDSSKI
jgi:hypothetical protein